MKSSYNVDAYLQARREDIVEIRQPNSRHCFVCGLENPFGLKLKFYQSKPDEVVVDCVLGEEYQGYPGVVHGGIVAAVHSEVRYTISEKCSCGTETAPGRESW
jgi:hypothetical protein